jgi:hypothetical protein
VHHRRDPVTDVAIVSHRHNADESSDVKQPEDSFLVLNGKAAAYEDIVCVSTASVRDAGKTVASAAAYAVARGLLSQFHDSTVGLDDTFSSTHNVNRFLCGSHGQLLDRSNSSSSEALIYNPPTTDDVKDVPQVHVRDIATSPLHVSSTVNPDIATCDEFVSGPSCILTSSTLHDSVFPSNSNTKCQTLVGEQLLTADGDFSSSPEATLQDLPALLCSFLFGSPESVTSCETAVTTLEEDPQIRCKNGSMDFLLSPAAGDVTQLQPCDDEERNCEILGASPTTFDAEDVISVGGQEISARDAGEQNDEGGSKVYRECNIEQLPKSASASREQERRTRQKRRMSSRASSHGKEIQRGISEESGYQTSSEGCVTGVETSSANKSTSEENDKTGDRDSETEEDGADEDLVLVPSGKTSTTSFLCLTLP